MSHSTDNLIRIVILDNQTLFRAGLRRIIEDHPGMKIVGKSGNFNEGLEIVSRIKPDIVIAELNLAGKGEIEIVPALIKASNETRVILVTGSSDPKIYQKAVEDGVMGIVLKTQSPEILIKAIEKVHSGEVWLERSLIANVLSRLPLTKPSSQKPEQELNNFVQLSEREKEVIKLIGMGYKNKRIAEELCISETTVRYHLTSIYNKLGVSDRLELLVSAHRHGLVISSPEE